MKLASQLSIGTKIAKVSRSQQIVCKVVLPSRHFCLKFSFAFGSFKKLSHFSYFPSIFSLSTFSFRLTQFTLSNVNVFDFLHTNTLMLTFLTRMILCIFFIHINNIYFNFIFRYLKLNHNQHITFTLTRLFFSHFFLKTND